MSEAVRPLHVLQMCAVPFTLRNIMLPLLLELKSKGYDVEVACSDGPQIAEVRNMGVKIHCINIHRKIVSLQNLKAIFSLYQLIKKNQYDIVHVHTPIAAVLGRIAARVAGTKMIVYTVHGFHFHDGMRPWLRFVFLNIEKLMCHWFSDLVFAVSQEDCDTAIKKNVVPKEKLNYVGNGVNLTDYSLVAACQWRSEIYQELQLDRFEHVIGFVGRLVREKGIIELIDAFCIVHERIPAAVLLIVGDTGAADRDTLSMDILSKKVAEKGLTANVVFTGYRQDVNRFLAAMDVFVLPSYREGLPISILEAMAMGLPVVATDIRGCREEVVDGKTGFLVPKKNAKVLGERIYDIIADKQKSDSFGQAGLERVQQFYDAKIVLKKQIELLEQYWKK